MPLEVANGPAFSREDRQRIGRRIAGPLVVDAGQHLQGPDDIEHLRAFEGEHDDRAGRGGLWHDPRLGPEPDGRKDNQPTFSANGVSATAKPSTGIFASLRGLAAIRPEMSRPAASAAARR